MLDTVKKWLTNTFKAPKAAITGIIPSGYAVCVNALVLPKESIYREFKVKLCKIKDRMQTTEGLKLADERHAFMEDFFKRFIEENEGKR